MARRLPLLFVLTATLSGCSFSLDWMQSLRVRRAIANRDFATALPLLRQRIEAHAESPLAVGFAREGARIAHLESKNYPVAVEFYRQLILRSRDPEERKSAQRFIAQIYFDNLLDYDQATLEFERLLKLEHRPEEAFRYRLNLAKCHFQLNNLDQAENELDVLLKGDLKNDEVFEAKVMKANILVSHKRLAEAAQAWDEILREYPERSKKENVALNLVVCYEELKDFGRAIEVLERMKADYANPDFLNLRIERLTERKQNMPGAQGLKR